MLIKILAPKAKVLERPKDKKLPEVPKKEKRTKTQSPSLIRACNDRNAANPRPGSVLQTINRISTVQYAEIKRQREIKKIKHQKMFEQHEAYFELKRAREREYYKVEEFLIELELGFMEPKMRWFIIN